MKRILVSVLLLACLAAGLILPVLAEPASLSLSAEGLALIQEFDSGATAQSVRSCESAVNAYASQNKLELTQQQFDALVSMTSDIGTSTLGYRYGQTVAKGDYTDTALANAWCAWVKKNGSFSETQLQRRIRELRVILYGDYSGEDSELSFRYLIFKANGGELTDNTVLCYPVGEVYGELPTANRSGKYFAGWFTAITDGTQIHSTSTVAENYTVYAQWSDAKPGEPTEPTDPDEPEEPIPVVRTSESGIQFIKDHEGFIPKPVWDYQQYSVGYGSHCGPDDYPDGITEKEADILLRKMLRDEFEPRVDALERKSGRTFSRQEYDALVSFSYNVGVSWMNGGYNIYRYVTTGNYSEMELVNCFGSWINAGGESVDGLARRRIDEVNLYLNGVYSTGSTAYLYVKFRLNTDPSTVSGEKNYDYTYYKPGTNFGTLPNASREGYNFLGWFEKASGGRQFTTDSRVPAYGLMTLYAHWEAAELEPEPEPEPDFPFTDVPKDAWYYPAIFAVYQKGWTNGTSATTFEPEYCFARSMMVTMLYRIENQPSVSTTSPFTDVRQGRFYTAPVAWAFNVGLTKGNNDGTTFGPDEFMTREQLATFFYRYAQMKGEDVSVSYDLSQHPDYGKMSNFSKAPMQWALSHGYLRLDSDGSLRPRESATRAESMDFIARYMGLIDPYDY